MTPDDVNRLEIFGNNFLKTNVLNEISRTSLRLKL
jgi:hypothetical protein